jgi:hypothetical protein
MRAPTLLLAVLAASLLVGAWVSRALPDQKPGTVHYSWLLRWPEQGKQQFFAKEFRAPPGLIRRVRVLIAGRPVAGPPYLSEVGCVGTRTVAAAQKSWLWNGRRVFVSLLLSPGRCRVAGTPVRVRVVLTSVGT